MEVIALILIVILALANASDKKKKAAKRAESQQVARPDSLGTAADHMSPAERQARFNEMRRRREARAAAAAAAEESAMPGKAEASFEASLTELKTLLNVTAREESEEGRSLLDDADCAGGSMPHSHAEGNSALDDAECAGGSMPHSHSQGQSRAEQRRRLSDMDRRREDEAERLVPRTIDARDMRRAVVMAEVLGKPKGLRKSRFVA